MQYLSIQKIVQSEYIVEKSKFISILYPCKSKQEAQEILNAAHLKYEDATHICYAYILKEDDQFIYKYDDDGEPSSTAGMPIFNVLQKNHLENILCLVIRYFGGIKLGAGGLVRAYTKSCSDAVNQAQIITYQLGFQYLLQFSYKDIKLVDYLLNQSNHIILEKKYELQVSYSILLEDENILENIKTRLANQVQVQFIKKDYIMKKNSQNL